MVAQFDTRNGSMGHALAPGIDCGRSGHSNSVVVARGAGAVAGTAVWHGCGMFDVVIGPVGVEPWLAGYNQK
jgi:hypothetical protein